MKKYILILLAIILLPIIIFTYRLKTEKYIPNEYEIITCNQTNGVFVEIPKDTVDQSIKFNCKKATELPQYIVATTIDALTDIYELRATDGLGQEIIFFRNEPIINVPNSNLKNNILVPDMFYYDDVTRDWISLSTQRYATNITAKASHIGYITVFGKETNTMRGDIYKDMVIVVLFVSLFLVLLYAILKIRK